MDANISSMKSASSQSTESNAEPQITRADKLHYLLDLTIDKISLRTDRPDALQDLREISLLCNTLENNMPVWDVPDAVCEVSGKELPLVEFGETKSLGDCNISITTVELPLAESRVTTAEVVTA